MQPVPVGILIVLQEDLNPVIHLAPDVLAKETSYIIVSQWQSGFMTLGS